MSLSPGTRLGPYEIVAPLGAGGMGEVYKARDPRLGRDVAIKVLPESFAADPSRLKRFEQEARAVAALSHPNILAIFDIGTGDHPFLITELLDGETLRAAIERGPLGLKRTTDLALQFIAGLSAAHGRGIVHRDLKPDNLFVTRDGIVKILDFGLAKHDDAAFTGEAGATIAATSAGLILGTVGYMAPEQVRGEHADPRSDLFAVGTILYEMISGQRAFHGDSPADTMSAVLREQPPDLVLRTGTPPALARIVRRCLEKEPADRFQSARDLRFAIESISDIQPATTPANPAAEKSIAVLPFEDLSADKTQQAFCEGMAAEIINALGAVERLRVVSRTSAVRCREKGLDIGEIGTHLHVHSVLEGAVRKSGERLRITVQLVNVADGSQLWTARYDRNEGDVFEIQDEIAAAVVENLKVRLAGRPAPSVKRATDNPAAYNLYLKGRYFWERRNQHFLKLALEHFERAIAEDPEYALAYCGIADCHTVTGILGFRDGREAYPLAKMAADRAIALDPLLAEAHHSVGSVRAWFEWDLAAATASFDRAIDLNPRLGICWIYRALLDATVGRVERVDAAVRTALELEPDSALLAAIGSNVLEYSRQLTQARAYANRALELDPTLLLGKRLRILLDADLGNHEEAIAAGERSLAESGRSADQVSALGYAYARAGRRDDAAAIVRELLDRRSHEYVAPLHIALVYTALDDRVRACEWLERAAEERNGLVNAIATAPHYDTLREEPRFRALLRRMGLPETLPRGFDRAGHTTP
jgi:TolB-like protein